MNRHDQQAVAPGPFARAGAEARRRRAAEATGLQHDPRFDRFRTVAVRRTMIVLGYLAMTASATIAWIDPDGPASVAAPAVFLLGLGAAFVLKRAARHVDDARDEALDERLIALRDAAFRRAYTANVVAVLGGLLAMMLGLGDAVEHRHLQAAFYAFGIGAVLTPLAQFTWSARKL